MKNWEANIRRVTPYTPGEQPREPRMIKLNTNENPYPPSPAVEQAAKELGADRLRLYPDPASSVLTEALAGFYRRKPEEIFVGVGSDDVLAMAFQTFFQSGKPILFPDITYSFYPVWAELFRIPWKSPALDSEFRIVKEDYFGENGGIVFPNPNAPTGIYIELVDRYDNLLVVQTFSKSRSMAGMRIGFAVGNPELIRYLNDVKYSFNSYTMSQAALELGAAAVGDETYFRETLGKIIRVREETKRELSALGFVFPDSRANFIFASHESCPAEELFEALKAEHIYVRHFHGPRIGNYLRITIGTEEQMAALLAFLRDYLKEHSGKRRKTDS